jgi:membrane associated rhomboid family serine protease
MARRISPYSASDTPGVWAILSLMVAFFVISFFGLADDIARWLAWPTVPAWFLDLRFWQMVTFPFVHGTNVLSVLFDGLVVYFFGTSLERAWGTPRFVSFFFLSGIVAGFTVIGLNALFPAVFPGGFFAGTTAHFVSLGVAFGALNPYARIYIYFVIPIEARWLGVISGVLEFFVNYAAYGSKLGAVIAIAVTALFSYAFTVGRFELGPRGGGRGGPSIKERFGHWWMRQRMRGWQKKVSKIDKPDDLFKK